MTEKIPAPPDINTGLGPVENDQPDQFIPYNMKNYQTKLLELLRRVQLFGVETYAYRKKSYLYTGSWMDYVKDIDDLMLQINGVNPNEACMKVFNVLFPYPKPLPIGLGDENSLVGFFDGDINIERLQENNLDCQPDKLRANLASKETDVAMDVAEKNGLNPTIEGLQELYEIKSEVEELRASKALLEFQLSQKDEYIAQLQNPEEDDQAEEEEPETDPKYAELIQANKVLNAQLYDLTEKNKDLEEEIEKLRQGEG